VVVSAAFTPGPWGYVRAEDRNGFRIRTGNHYDGGLFICDGHTALPGELAHAEANARLIAAAPELFDAAAKHLEWIEKEHAGPQYGDLTRDTHPLGEAIWQQWWNEQLDLCAETERLCRAALAKARGDQ
jgi:hypothetical protein